MHDYESAAWAEHHAQLSNTVRRFFDDIIAAFGRLQARQFDAPWRASRRAPIGPR